MLKKLTIFPTFDYYTDDILKEAIHYKVSYLLTQCKYPYVAAYYVSLNPDSGLGLFNFLR